MAKTMDDALVPRVEARFVLDALNFSIAGGLVWGLALLGLSAACSISGGGSLLPDALSSLYAGHGPGPAGAIAGFLYGFADAFIGCFIFASVYNALQIKGP